MKARHSIRIFLFLAVLALCSCSTPTPSPTLQLADTTAIGLPSDSESVAPVAQAAYLLYGNLYLNVTTAEGSSPKIARGEIPADKNKLGLSVPSGHPGTPPIADGL
jgi:hypothetical protein